MRPIHALRETRLEARPDWALFLDVDGTLLHIAETPDAVRVGHELRAVIKALLPGFQGAVALVSGRGLVDLDRLFAPLVLPAAGQHGLERRDGAGRVHRAGDSHTLYPLRSPLQRFVQARPGTFLEDKGLTLAIHYRRVPQRAVEAQNWVDELIRVHDHRFHALHGKMVSEIRLRAADKGTAIDAFLREPPFSGRRPVFVGDDVTDEVAFAAVNGRGGYSVHVGHGEETCARYRLDDVTEVIAWLGISAARLGGGGKMAAS